MSNISSWSTTAASNNSASPNGWPEAMNPSGVNDSAREMMASLAKWFADTNGSVTATGSSNAFAITTNQVITSYAAGQAFAFIANHSNTGSVTIDVDGLGAKSIRKNFDEELVSGDITSGQVVVIIYDNSNSRFQAVSPLALPLLSASNLSDLPDASAARTNLGLAIGTDVQAFDQALADIAGLTLTADKVLAVNSGGTAIELGPTTTDISNAATNASAAAASAAAAATSESNAAASYDSFDDRYLGAKTSDPALDNDGDALIDGAMYFNTTSNDMMVYDLGGTAWVSVSNSASSAAAAASAAAALASENAAAADLVLTNADVVLTGLDVAATNADVVLTNADVVATGVDVTAADADATAASNSATAASNSAAAAAASAAEAAATAAGISWKAPCKVATTANITLSGEQTIDTVLTSASRVLVKDQTDATENGVYISDVGAWTRATPMDEWDEFVGAVVAVSEGAVSEDIAYLCTNNAGGTLGVTDIEFSAFGAAPTAVTMIVDNYADGVDYTSGTTTSLAMSQSQSNEDNIVVTFDGVTQHHNTYTVSGVTVTFDAAIPTGTNNVEIRGSDALGIGTPGAGSVGTTELSAGPVKDLNQLAVTNGLFYVGDGTNIVAESGDTARTSLGLGTGDSPTFTDVTVTGDFTDADGGVITNKIPQNAQTGNYTLVSADAGKHIYHASGAGSGDTYTIPANSSVAYPIGTALTFVNSDSNDVSIGITTDTMTLAGDTATGTRTLAQNGVATAIKVTSTSWLISGTGLT